MNPPNTWLLAVAVSFPTVLRSVYELAKASLLIVHRFSQSEDGKRLHISPAAEALVCVCVCVCMGQLVHAS